MFEMSIWMAFFFFVVILYLGISMGLTIARHILNHPDSRFWDLLLTQQDE
jgi:hypothetical protein